ncbi:hypothetical protein HK102_010561 [Quaeritorhiza haematococci]|nr:hypothetical protein HK102_010561 [Quaeritorhiza haematococci]
MLAPHKNLEYIARSPAFPRLVLLPDTSGTDVAPWFSWITLNLMEKAISTETGGPLFPGGEVMVDLPAIAEWIKTNSTSSTTVSDMQAESMLLQYMEEVLHVGSGDVVIAHGAAVPHLLSEFENKSGGSLSFKCDNMLSTPTDVQMQYETTIWKRWILQFHDTRDKVTPVAEARYLHERSGSQFVELGVAEAHGTSRRFSEPNQKTQYHFAEDESIPELLDMIVEWMDGRVPSGTGDVHRKYSEEDRMGDSTWLEL